MEYAIESAFNSWLVNHPLLAWCLQHPLISLVGILVVIVLTFRLFAALAYLLDKLWLWILRSPILLLRSLFGIKKKKPEVIAIEPVAIDSESAKIELIIQQLDKIQLQQQQIIQEIERLKETPKIIK